MVLGGESAVGEHTLNQLTEETFPALSAKLNSLVPPSESVPVHSAILAEDQIPLLLTKLERKLPHSLPLTRRLQFHFRCPNKPWGHVYLAIVGETHEHNPAIGADGERSWVDSWFYTSNALGLSDELWIAAHIDLSNSGQTQAWIFASWEIPEVHRLSVRDEVQSDAFRAATWSLMQKLFKDIRTELVPAMPCKPSPEWKWLIETGKYLSVPYSRSKVLFGTVHETLIPFFQNSTRKDSNYLKYLFPLQEAAPESLPPEGYHFGDMRIEDLQTVVDRTRIPRTLSTLKMMESVALYHDSQERPVGWGFLGKDASISSLHTEPEHRGRGLAGALTKELMRRQNEAFPTIHGMTQKANTWAHADVSVSNAGSRRVMEKLGGQAQWKVAWIELELNDLVEP